MLIRFLLNGKEINLTSDNVVIESNNFKVDKDGNMTCNDANVNNVNINKGKINLTTESSLDQIFNVTDNQGNNAHISATRIWLNRSFGTAVYLQNASQACLDLHDQDGSNTTIYGNGITTPKLTQTSLESEKKNFEKLQNAIDIIKKTDIYKYNLKAEKDTDKKHIGFVIGDNYKYSEELTSKENDGADIYSLASCCLQAIKEQQEIIENLQNDIKELKESRN